MNKGIEFIKKFVIPNKQERLIWELESPKKKRDIFWRFAGSSVFKEELLQETDYMTIDELEAKLYQLEIIFVFEYLFRSYRQLDKTNNGFLYVEKNCVISWI